MAMAETKRATSFEESWRIGFMSRLDTIIDELPRPYNGATSGTLTVERPLEGAPNAELVTIELPAVQEKRATPAVDILRCFQYSGAPDGINNRESLRKRLKLVRTELAAAQARLQRDGHQCSGGTVCYLMEKTEIIFYVGWCYSLEILYLFMVTGAIPTSGMIVISGQWDGSSRARSRIYRRCE